MTDEDARWLVATKIPNEHSLVPRSTGGPPSIG